MRRVLERYEKYAAFFSFMMMQGCLIPMAILGFYNHPVGDDYYYGYAAIMAMQDTGNILEVLKAAVAGTVEQYHIWQGTYSAMFFMHLPPQVFGDLFYRLYPTILFTCFVTGLFYLTYGLFCKVLKAEKNAWILVTSLLVLLCTQQVPLCGETFYWYNGSMYYTGFLACTFWFWGGVIRLLIKQSVKRTIGLSLLALFLAGGNYASLLPTIIILALLLVVYGYWVFVNKESHKRLFLMLFIIFACMLMGFLISVLAPGNAVRQATSWKISPILAVAKAIYHSMGYCIHWNGIWSVLFAILLTPSFIKVIGGCAWKFKHPVVVCGLMFGIYCSASCPTFYAQNNGGAARVFCLVYYLMIITQTMMYFYALGAICRFAESGMLGKRIKNVGRSRFFMAGLLVLVFFLVLCLNRSFSSLFIKPNAVTAVKALISGEAQYYDRQYRERVLVLEDDSVSEVVFKPYDVPEALNYYLYLGDLSQDETTIVNQQLADIYNKSSIKVASD